MIDLLETHSYKGKDNSQIFRMTGSGKGSPTHAFVRDMASFVAVGGVKIYGIDPMNQGFGYYGLRDTNLLENVTSGLTPGAVQAHGSHIETLADTVRHRLNIGGMDAFQPDAFNRPQFGSDNEAPTVLVLINDGPALRAAFEQCNVNLSNFDLLMRTPNMTNVFVLGN